MHLFRRLAETSQLPTGVYADFFQVSFFAIFLVCANHGIVVKHNKKIQFAEQYNAVLPGTLSSIAYAGAAVIAVSLMLIPEPIASLWVDRFAICLKGK